MAVWRFIHPVQNCHPEQKLLKRQASMYDLTSASRAYNYQPQALYYNFKMHSVLFKKP